MSSTHKKTGHRLVNWKWILIGFLAAIGALFWPRIAVQLSPYVPKILLGEQCSRVWIKSNLTELNQAMESNVFGQHIARKLVLGALKRRWTSDPNLEFQKPLVMSFHGWTGSGKNYVAKFIAESMFEAGLSSKFVSFLSSTLHFHDSSKVLEYKQQLQDWVKSNVSACGSSLFIIDEVDKMPAGVLDGLKPFMDYHDSVDGVDFRKAVFVLLSNTGGREITKVALDFWKAGKSRETMTNFDLERLISKGAFNEEGGLQRTLLIERSLIDYHIPFLPLESKHVRQCIGKELQSRGLDPQSYGEVVEKTLKQLAFWPKDFEVFASSGCKRVVQKLDEVMFDSD